MKSRTVEQLFDKQFGLDAKIKTNMMFEKSMEQMLNDKIMALVVEVGEMANEYRGFKYWSKKGPNLAGTKEEYIDVLHFVLSIGNDLFDSDIAELLKAYDKKHDINLLRQKEGY